MTEDELNQEIEKLKHKFKLQNAPLEILYYLHDINEQLQDIQNILISRLPKEVEELTEAPDVGD